MKKLLSEFFVLVILICGFIFGISSINSFADTDISGWEYKEGAVKESETGIEICKGASLNASLNPEKIIFNFGGFAETKGDLDTAVIMALTPSKTMAEKETPVTYGGVPTQTGLIILLGYKGTSLTLIMGFNVKNDEEWAFSYISAEKGDVINIVPDKPFSIEISTEGSPYIKVMQSAENNGSAEVVKNYTASCSGLENYISADGKTYFSIYNMASKGFKIQSVKTKGVADNDTGVEDTEEKDNLAPTLNVGELKAECEALEEITLPKVTATDNVDEKVSVSVSVIDPNGNDVLVSNDKFIPDKVGTYNVVFSATDISGNIAQETRKINIKKPSGAVISFSSTVSDTAELGVEFKIPVVSATANEKAVSVESLIMYVKFPNADEFIQIPDANAVLNKTFNVFGVCTFYYVATDVWENEYVSDYYTVEIKDTIAPVLSVSGVPEKLEVKTKITLPWCEVTDADENVDFKITVTLNGEDVTDAKQHEFTPQSIGEYVVEYSATDGSENRATEKFTIVVVDTTAPEIFVEFSESTAFGNTVVLPQATASDNYTESVEILISVTDPNGESVVIADGKFIARKVGSYTVIYTAVDGEGNSTSETFSLTVEGVPPELYINGTMPTDGIIGVEIILPNVSATDALGESVTVVPCVKLGESQIDVVNGKFIPETVGEYSVFFVATDSENNTVISETYKINIFEKDFDALDDNGDKETSDEPFYDANGCGANYSAVSGLGCIIVVAVCRFMKKSL